MASVERPRIVSSARLAGALTKNAIWRAAYRRWPRPIAPEMAPGYTLVMPVPGDLPVFLRLALANIAAQDPVQRSEVLVVPDRPNPVIADVFAACRVETGLRDVRLIPLSPLSRALSRAAGGDGATNYFLQLHAGVAATATTHALAHDADLFLTDAGFLARHFQRCSERRLACLGVSPAWDGWLREHGFDHVLATWELMFDVRWMRSFAPWRHRSHFAWVQGEWHGFDVTLCTQAKTPPRLCELHPGAESSFVHFNWVIAGYRQFQRRGGRQFVDAHFIMLLIRLLTDALDARVDGVPSLPVDIPSADALARGLTDPSGQVTYQGDGPASNYAGFRHKIRLLYQAPLLTDAAVDAIERRLAPFDRAFL